VLRRVARIVAFGLRDEVSQLIAYGGQEVRAC